MIVKPPPRCGDLVSLFSKGSIVYAILPQIILSSLVGACAALMESRGWPLLKGGFAPFGAFRVILWIREAVEESSP